MGQFGTLLLKVWALPQQHWGPMSMLEMQSHRVFNKTLLERTRTLRVDECSATGLDDWGRETGAAANIVFRISALTTNIRNPPFSHLYLLNL